MKRIKRSIIWTCVGMGLGIVLMVLINTAFKPSSSTSISSTVLKNSLVQAQDLTTTKYTYAKVGKFENSLEINGWTIPLTKKNFLLTYQGEVDLGVDMSQVDVKIRGSRIEVKCPAISILSNTIDEKTIEIYEESRNPLNQMRISDYLEFSLQQKASALADLQKQDGFEKAQKDAEAAITQLLNMIPDVAENYTVEITFDPMPDYAAQAQEELSSNASSQEDSSLKDQISTDQNESSSESTSPENTETQPEN